MTEKETDLLYGVPAIAEHLGLREKQCRSRIEAKQIPTFKIGGTLCSRKSTLKTWLDEQEGKANADD